MWFFLHVSLLFLSRIPERILHKEIFFSPSNLNKKSCVWFLCAILMVETKTKGPDVRNVWCERKEILSEIQSLCIVMIFCFSFAFLFNSLSLARLLFRFVLFCFYFLIHWMRVCVCMLSSHMRNVWVRLCVLCLALSSILFECCCVFQFVCKAWQWWPRNDSKCT